MTPFFFFFGRHPRVPASLNVPQTSLDQRSLEFAMAFQNRVQQALDRGREGQVQLIRDMAPRRDQAVHFQVGGQAWLRADEYPISGDKHFKLPWARPFTIVAVTPSRPAGSCGASGPAPSSSVDPRWERGREKREREGGW